MRATLAAWLICIGAQPALAQTRGIEEWLLTVVSEADSAVDVVPFEWRGDSAFAMVRAWRLSLVIRADSLNAELRRPNGDMQKIAATRVTGDKWQGWITGAGLPRRGWRGERLASATDLNAPAPERWIFSRSSASGVLQQHHLNARWRGDTLIGLILPDSLPLTAVLRGNDADGVFALGRDRAMRTRATGRRDSLAGTFRTIGGQGQTGTWSAVRASTARAPRTVSYDPPKFYQTYAWDHAPGIRIGPGDTVRTVARGAPGGNVPAPIFVEGTLPGDVIAVHVISITPAEKAWSRRPLELDWFTAEFARRAVAPPVVTWRWLLDLRQNVARLDTACAQCQGPAYQQHRALRIPLQVHLGNIGVAPRGMQAIESPDEGDYGGNLDYSALTSGSTLYLPVFHPGALLSVAGDVHALQGDGELVGTGLEMDAADVVFTVSVIRSANVTHVRAEDANYIMAFGTSADLSQALRLANTHLAEMLEAEYKLNSAQVGLLIGTVVKLDIANVWGGQATIVAKIPKAYLRHIAK